jgi:ABC-type oligopeptide transport system substrate-binding subunit
MAAVPVADPTRRHMARALLGRHPEPHPRARRRARGAPLVQVGPGHFVARHAVGGAYEIGSMFWFSVFTATDFTTLELCMKHTLTACRRAGRHGAALAPQCLRRQGRRGGRGVDFTTMDPYDANDTLSQAVAKSFYQGLMGFDKNMKMVPVLAESYTASKDGLTYTFKLKKGIKFHDGTDFNAEAVKATFDRVTNAGQQAQALHLYKNIAKTEAIDATTVKFTLAEPFSPSSTRWRTHRP